MSARYFYLELDLCGAEESSLLVRRLVQEAAQRLFGECGGAALGVDVLRAGGGSALVRVPAAQESITWCSVMSGRSVLVSGPDDKDLVLIASREELAAPSTVSLPEPEPAPGLILADGSINWGCPCLGGMATGPCGNQFRDAFSCFHYSEADPKGSDCYEKFSVMQDCMSHFPELYGKDEDDELAAAMSESDAGSAGTGAGAGAAAAAAAAGDAPAKHATSTK